MIIFACTSAGPRPRNEDSVAWLLRELRAGTSAAVVADGMGGMGDGHIASSIVCDAVMSVLGTAPRVDDATFADWVREVFAYAHHRVRLEGRKKNSTMQTTCAAVFFDATSFVVAHIGDTRVYRIPADGACERLTRDHHTDVEDPTARGVGGVTRSLGGDCVDAVEISAPFSVFTGERLLVVTDGITGSHRDPVVDDEEIARLAASRRSPRSFAAALLARATERDTRDNATLTVIDFNATREGKGDLPVTALQVEQWAGAAAQPHRSLFGRRHVAAALLLSAGVVLMGGAAIALRPRAASVSNAGESAGAGAADPTTKVAPTTAPLPPVTPSDANELPSKAVEGSPSRMLSHPTPPPQTLPAAAEGESPRRQGASSLPRRTRRLKEDL